MWSQFAYNKFNMADGRHFEKLINLHISERFDLQSPQNLATVYYRQWLQWTLFKKLMSVLHVTMNVNTGPPNGPVNCFARCRLSTSSVVVCNAAGVRVGRPRGRSARRRPGVCMRSSGRHCTASQYCYVPSWRHLVIVAKGCKICYRQNDIVLSSVVTIIGRYSSRR